jgi:Transposase DDE domain
MFWCDSTRLNINGAGQWLDEKHGAKSRDGWRKLHLAFDADSGKIIAHSLTVQEISDASQLEPLLDQIDDEIGQFTADGTHDSYPNYDAVLGSSAGAKALRFLDDDQSVSGSLRGAVTFWDSARR